MPYLDWLESALIGVDIFVSKRKKNDIEREDLQFI